MELLTQQKYNDFSANFAKNNQQSNINAPLITITKEEKKLMTKLKAHNFFKLINIIGTKKRQGDIIGFFPTDCRKYQHRTKERTLHDVLKVRSGNIIMRKSFLIPPFHGKNNH